MHSNPDFYFFKKRCKRHSATAFRFFNGAFTMDDTDWILMDFTAPKLPEKTDKKPSANKPLGCQKKTVGRSKTGAGATKKPRKASAKLMSKKV